MPWIAIPLELALTFGSFFWYIRRTAGPALAPIFLALLLLAARGFSWFGPAPDGSPPALAALALATFVDHHRRLVGGRDARMASHAGLAARRAGS